MHGVDRIVMPIEDRHLIELRVGGRRYAIPNPERYGPRDQTFSAKTTRLGALVDRGVTEFSYAYDFGDDWRHIITIEAVFDADPAMDYRRYLNGAHRAPPADVGCVPGFERFIEAMVDPRQEKHDELKRWRGAPFDRERIEETGSGSHGKARPASGHRKGRNRLI